MENYQGFVMILGRHCEIRVNRIDRQKPTSWDSSRLVGRER
jgi:hypothetical protein